MIFQTGLSFTYVYMKKSYRDGPNTIVCSFLVKVCQFILKTYGEENQHGKSIIINRYIKYITACSFLRKQFNITCKSITLLIKRNSRTKQSDSIFETNMGNVFCILWNFNVHSHHLICYLLYKLTHVRRICKICLLQSTNNVLSEATILVRSSQQKWSIKSLFLKISKYSQENTNVLWSLFLTKLQD